jgi:transposase
VLSIDERAALLALIRPTGQAWMLLRARIVVAAADGANNAGIARDLAVCADTVRKWPGRYARDRLAGLADAHRPGRPRRFSAVQRAQLTAIACELPATRGMPLSRWSSFELACEAIEAGIVVDISASTVRRWLAADAIKPWQYRSWIAPRAPDFAAKATVVLDLYARVFDGQPLGPGDYVLCADEKTSVQARCRCHPSLAPGKARMMRVEHEYQRPRTRRCGVPAIGSGNSRSGRGCGSVSRRWWGTSTCSCVAGRSTSATATRPSASARSGTTRWALTPVSGFENYLDARCVGGAQSYRGKLDHRTSSLRG